MEHISSFFQVNIRHISQVDSEWIPGFSKYSEFLNTVLSYAAVTAKFCGLKIWGLVAGTHQKCKSIETHDFFKVM